MCSRRIVICGAGFIGSHVARAFASSPVLKDPQIVLASRHPTSIHGKLLKELPDLLAPPAVVDITKRDSLRNSFEGADVVVSLVGILMGSPATFDQVQWMGAENVALVAREQNAKLTHLSAIGADPNSPLPSPRTKALGEQAVLAACPSATIFRPSLVFGPGDSFFMRFATLSRFLPFVPIFGGGHSKFQPVYVGDLARAIELSARHDLDIEPLTNGKIIETGGPDVVTYRQMMELVLKYTNRYRPIVSVPFAVGRLQAAVLERLPESVLSLSRDQVEQLAKDNLVAADQADVFPSLLKQFAGIDRSSVHKILPTYL